MLQFEHHLPDIKHHGQLNAHVTAIGLLEVYITAYATAESSDEVIDNFPQAKAVHRAYSRPSPHTSWYVQFNSSRSRALGR
jgi:hypothetical protein